jgi:hypothetical protein
LDQSAERVPDIYLVLVVPIPGIPGTQVHSIWYS